MTDDEKVLSLSFLQVVVFYDVAERRAVVDITDEAGEHTNLRAMACLHEVFNRIAYAVVAAESCHVYLLYAVVFYDAEEFRCAGAVRHDRILVYCHIVTLC